MSSHQLFDEGKTVSYYNENAVSFYARSINIDMRDIHKPFLDLVPRGGHILDAGCGSGRDSLAFIKAGYRVTSIDASGEMVRLASELTGQKALQLRFQGIDFHEEFDGIWACASLVHIQPAEMDEVLNLLAAALKPGGTWYMSFKQGESEYLSEGRYFRDYTESSVMGLLQKHKSVEIVRIWLTPNKLCSAGNTTWVNALVHKC